MVLEDKKIVFVHADDWEGVYIDGKLVYEYHYVESEKLCSLLGIKCEYRWVKSFVLEQCGNALPLELSDIDKIEKGETDFDI